MKIEPGKPVMMVGNMKLMKQLKKVIKMNMLRQFHRGETKRPSLSDNLKGNNTPTCLRTRAQELLVRNTNIVPVIIEEIPGGDGVASSHPHLWLSQGVGSYPDAIYGAHGEVNSFQQVKGTSPEENRDFKKIYYLSKDFTVRELISLLKQDPEISKDATTLAISVQEDVIPSPCEKMGLLYALYPEWDLHLHLFYRKVSVTSTTRNGLKIKKKKRDNCDIG